MSAKLLDSLPIAQELIPRRVRIKPSLAADFISNNAPFPSNDASIFSSNSGGPVEVSEASPATSNPPASTFDKVPNHTKRSDSLRKRTQSTPLQSSLGTSKPHQNKSSSPTAVFPQKSASLEQSPKGARKNITNTSSSLSQPSTEKPRVRVLTSNNLQSRKQPTNATNAFNPTSKRSPHAKSTPRQVSTPLRKSAGPSSTSSTPLRSRSQSASLLYAPSISSSTGYGLDTNAKPPWVDETPNYLYKSDITSPAFGSLAHIALHAQGRINGAESSSSISHLAGQTANGEDGDESFEAAVGNTSARSWDDVILPAVAKQIRARQALEMQNMAALPSHDGSNAEDLLVTEWSSDGTPRKWSKFPARHEEALQKPDDGTMEEDIVVSKIETVRHDGRPDQLRPSRSLSHRPSRQSINCSFSTPSLAISAHTQQSTAQHPETNPPALQSVSSHASLPRAPVPTTPTLDPRTLPTSVDGSRNSKGRQEVWQQAELASPTVAKKNGFGIDYERGTADMPLQAGEKEAQQKKPGQMIDGKDVEGVHKGGCRCVIM